MAPDPSDNAFKEFVLSHGVGDLESRDARRAGEAIIKLHAFTLVELRAANPERMSAYPSVVQYMVVHLFTALTMHAVGLGLLAVIDRIISRSTLFFTPLLASAIAFPILAFVVSTARLRAKIIESESVRAGRRAPADLSLGVAQGVVTVLSIEGLPLSSVAIGGARLIVGAFELHSGIMKGGVGFHEVMGIVVGATIIFIGVRAFRFARALSALVSDLTYGRLELR